MIESFDSNIKTINLPPLQSDSSRQPLQRMLLRFQPSEWVFGYLARAGYTTIKLDIYAISTLKLLT